MASRPVRSGSSLGVRWADAVRAVDPPQGHFTLRPTLPSPQGGTSDPTEEE
jgi:hypothetical protein